MVAKIISNMNDNRSPGVDGIPPKLLLEIVEQNQHTTCNSAQFFIRGLSSSVRMESSKHYTFSKNKFRETSQRIIDQ